MDHRKWTGIAIAVAVVGAIAGCGGGGGDAGVRSDTYSIPLVGTGVGIEQRNARAHDLGEHWGDPVMMARLLGASGPGGDTAGLATALEAAGERTPRASSMRSITAQAMTPIGARGAIGVGHWTAGPADTLDIDFDFDAAPGLTQADRARIERAGKMWSYHLVDDFEVRTTAPNTVVDFRDDGLPSVTLEAPRIVDDVLVVVTTGTVGQRSYAGSERSLRTEDDYEPWLGKIFVNTGRGHQRDGGILVHEVGHVLGFVESTPGGRDVPTIERYMSADRLSFEGPASMRANGGSRYRSSGVTRTLGAWRQARLARRSTTTTSTCAHR